MNTTTMPNFLHLFVILTSLVPITFAGHQVTRPGPPPSEAPAPAPASLDIREYIPIKDLQDKHVVEIAKFAVAEHNTMAKTSLQYGGISTGDKLFFHDSTNYRLVIAAKSGVTVHYYEALVRENGGFDLEVLNKKLIYFMPISN